MATATTNKLIGKGIKFPFEPSISKGAATSESIERINQSLFILFGTRKGSRLMMPEFGSDIYKYRFDPYDNILLDNLRDTVREDIRRWEPRVTIENMEFSYSVEDIDNHILYISIHYKVINTEVSGNFVYPFRRDVYAMSNDAVER